MRRLFAVLTFSIALIASAQDMHDNPVPTCDPCPLCYPVMVPWPPYFSYICD